MFVFFVVLFISFFFFLFFILSGFFFLLFTKFARGHASLGLDSYARVTSPARRYPDIVNHRQVRKGKERENGGYACYSY